MNKQIALLLNASESLKSQIIQHPLYREIQTPEDLCLFMKYHIYAVWDFMSILKSLQASLTCTTSPWFPRGDAETRFLINEIVVGEESDLNAEGRRQSHFEIYLDAMNQIGADTSAIHMFMESLRQHSDFDLAYQYAQTPLAAQAFMNFTFNTISQNQNHVLAAIFTFGREDLIPGMFRNMVDEFHQKMPERISIFKYYLDRHIEIDGDHHSPLAMQMVANLCGEDENKWREAEAHVIDALRQRLNLWNAALTEIQLSKQITA